MAQPIGYPSKPPSADQLIYSDGEPMESARHFQQMVVLVQSLELAWEQRSDFYVGGDMFLYFSETQSRRNDFRGPDVFVVMNTSRRERRAWVVWEENGQAPDVVIELVSDTTESVDRGEKKRIYSRILKVPEYFLFDPFSGVLEGYELDALHGEYRLKHPDAQGRLACVRTGLLLGKVRGTLHAVETDWLRWLTPEGEVLPVASELAHSLASRATTESARAETAEQRANAEAERANAEAERANAEAERARELAAEVERLRAQLRK